MKNAIQLSTAMLCVLILWAGCSGEVFTEKGVKELDNAHSVSLEAVSRLATAMARGDAATKAEGFQQPEIIPIVDIYKDTLFYAVNFFSGWKLISSDKRTPIVLAENEQGEFSLEDMDYGAGAWLECMAQDLRGVKESPDWKLPGTDNGLYFEDFWNSLTPAETKSNESYYDIYSTYTERISDREVGHLLSTRWCQRSPYNKYCPFKTNSNTERVPAGCVAVAGAQMLYYLHGKIGRPTEAPTSGECIGVAHNYSQAFSDFSADAWDYMDYTHWGYSSDYVAMLIGWVGMSVNMYYSNTGSGAWNSNLASFINSLGIYCQNRTYDSELASLDLLDSIPVIMGAYGNLSTLDIPDIRDGHTFIIDGYRTVKHRTYLTYAKYNPVVDADSSGCVMYVPEPNDSYMVVTESEPWINQVRMNWGWSNNNDNTWYSTTDRWVTTNRREDGTIETEDFYYNRRMIHDFRVL